MIYVYFLYPFFLLLLMLCCIMSICIQLFLPFSKISKYNVGEPSFDERHHDVPKFSDINSLEKSATIHGKGIKSLIKIETIVKSKIFK